MDECVCRCLVQSDVSDEDRSLSVRFLVWLDMLYP